MKSFIAALALFALIIGATVANAIHIENSFEALCEELQSLSNATGEENADQLKKLHDNTESQRKFLHLSLREAEFDRLLLLLSDAHECCRAGDTGGYLSAKASALHLAGRFRDSERLSAVNIL